MFSKFVHLHVHSEYSLDIGFFSINDYVRFCYENRVITACITEKFNLFSAVKFYNECLKFCIKPIIGCELFLEYDENNFSKALFLSQNINGYKNLIKILSQSYFNIRNGIPLVKKAWLPFFSNDLIVIGLSFESDVAKCILNNDYQTALETLKFWKKSFPSRYYLSITKFNFIVENIYIYRLAELVKKCKINLVATNEVCFLKETDFISYKSKLLTFDLNKNIFNKDSDFYFKNKYFKKSNVMYNLFNENKTLLYNSFEIAKRCNTIFNTNNNFSPKYLKTNTKNITSFLSKISIEQLFNKLRHVDKNHWHIYINRLQKELNVINITGFADYFLITHDFIKWARKYDIMVGPGRGSGSGSLIAYLLSITNINPINYNLLFERFLNSYRISNPDFDIDFCIEGRELIIDYIFTKYGSKYVAQIITFGIMAVKAVIKDIGRVLGYSYAFVNKIVKLISNNFGITLKSELIENKILKTEYDNSYDVQIIINLALKLEGMIKNISKHAGGLIISNTNFSNTLPVIFDKNEHKFITSFDKNDSEHIGFSKFDFLGLKTLSTLNTILETIRTYINLNFNTNPIIENKITFDNNKAFLLLQRADTLGIFQLESIGIKSIIQRLKPDSFFDIVALIALYRPGPLQSGMLKTFINRRLGTENISYIHKVLKRVLGETYGMLIYQEQVMLIAQLFAGYDIGFADFLRIAMSKKNRSDILMHFENFKNSIILQNTTIETVAEIFNLIEKFAGYGFNKAHSVGYGFITYNSIWLKSQYNTFFFSALISSDIDNYDNGLIYIKEMEYFFISILIPDINRSFYTFTLVNKYSIRYGLGAIKGIGKSVIAEIIHNRSIFGPYNSFFDFFYRLNFNILSKRVLESLIYSGCFDKINLLKFKLILISTKVLDIYEKINNISKEFFLNTYFNYNLDNFDYTINYKQNEIKESLNLIPTKNLLNFYLYDNNLILKLSYKSGKYVNNFFCGVIKNIITKKTNIIINIIGLSEKKDIIFSHHRFKYFEKILKKNNFITLLYYTYNNNNYELFAESFYIFKYKFLKYIDIFFFDSKLSESFLKFLLFNMTTFIDGYTSIRFRFPFKGMYKLIKLDYNIKIIVHDNIISDLLKYKEVKGIKFIYNFF